MSSPFWQGFEKRASWQERMLHWMSSPTGRAALQGMHGGTALGLGAGVIHGATSNEGDPSGLRRVGRALGHGLVGAKIGGGLGAAAGYTKGKVAPLLARVSQSA